MDTIFALSTAWGKAGLAVIRLSGPLACDAAEKLVGRLPPPKQAALRRLTDSDGRVLDEGLVLRFEEGSSFTGENVVELQIHGGQASVSAVLAALGEIDGLRLAEPGEFTYRAMCNGRLDISQVEGLADLIDAETEAQRRQAMRIFSGELGQRASEWNKAVTRSLALLEACIDFADEEIPESTIEEAEGLIDALISELGAEAAGAEVAERVRSGFEVAIVGPPNVGKSTLLNCISKRDAAITSEYAGTTRDVIEVRMDLKGLPITILDTAGLHESEDPVESIGIAKAIERAESADMRIFLTENDTAEALQVDLRSGDLILRSKADLAPEVGMLAVSGKTGQGVSELVENVHRELAKRVAGVETATRERHRLAIKSAIKALESCAHELSDGGRNLEVAAEELRSAADALGALIGKIDAEKVLGEIFASFCVGK